MTRHDSPNGQKAETGKKRRRHLRLSWDEAIRAWGGWLERFLDWEDAARGRTSHRHQRAANLLADAVLHDVWMRLLERRGLLDDAETRRRFFELRQRIRVEEAASLRAHEEESEAEFPRGAEVMDEATAREAALLAFEAHPIVAGLISGAVAAEDGVRGLDTPWICDAGGDVSFYLWGVISESEASLGELKPGWLSDNLDDRFWEEAGKSDWEEAFPAALRQSSSPGACPPPEARRIAAEMASFLGRLLSWAEPLKERKLGHVGTCMELLSSKLTRLVLTRLMERWGLLDDAESHREIMALTERERAAWPRFSFRADDELKEEPLDFETAQAAARLAAEAMDVLEKAETVVSSAGNALDCLWFRRSAGNAMNLCRTILKDVRAVHANAVPEDIGGRRVWEAE